MDFNNILENTELIINNLNNLDGNINKIKKKIGLINKIYNKLEKNNVLSINKNTYLLFQTQFLKNEHMYYSNIYKMIVEKFAFELYDISEYICIILVSLNKLEINNLNSKQSILNRMIHINKVKQINYGKLTEIINSTISNLKLINEFNALFDSFVNKTKKENNTLNIHCDNYEINITNKKNLVLLEYNKYMEKFNKLIEYFKKCLIAIINQIDNSELLNFFLNEPKPTQE